jgi:phage-related tail protein
MKPFRQGIVVGLILSVFITVALALTLNDERRRRLSYRLEKLRDALSNPEQVKQSVQDAAIRAKGTSSNLSEQMKQSVQDAAIRAKETSSNLSEQVKQSVQDAAVRAKETGSNLGGQVQESAGKLVQHSQEILNAAQKKAASLGDK